MLRSAFTEDCYRGSTLLDSVICHDIGFYHLLYRAHAPAKLSLNQFRIES
jgi:hypothetical protein